MIKFSRHEHDIFLRACTDPRATEEEREHLSYCAAMCAAGEPVTAAEYLRAQALTGGALSTITPIFQRKNGRPLLNPVRHSQRKYRTGKPYFVIGRPRGSIKTRVQSVLLPRSRFNRASARAWLKRQGLKHPRPDVTPNFLRFRQADPGRFQRGSFRMIHANPNPVLSPEANELYLFIVKDGELYRGQTEPIIKNLARKMKRGIYDHEKAVRLWRYLADSGAKKYSFEHDVPQSGVRSWRAYKGYGIFAVKYHLEAARELARYYLEPVSEAAGVEARIVQL